MNRKLFYARYCAKLYAVFAKALAEADPLSKGYSKLFSDTLYYRTRMINAAVNSKEKGGDFIVQLRYS